MQNSLSPTLENEFVLLSPLSFENYENLIPVALQETLIQYSPSDISSPAALRNYVAVALEQKERKTSIPYIIFDKKRQQYAGSTRYMNIHWKNKVLEIGAT